MFSKKTQTASDVDRQLKEVYDELELEKQTMRVNLEYLREEQQKIIELLDSKNIPKTNNAKILSLIERLELALNNFDAIKNMGEKEFCIICAEKYKEQGNLRMYKKYLKHASRLSSNAWSV